MYLIIAGELLIVWTEGHFQARSGVVAGMMRVRLGFVADRSCNIDHAANGISRDRDRGTDVFGR